MTANSNDESDFKPVYLGKVDETQTFEVSFGLESGTDQDLSDIRQVFLRMEHSVSGQEIIFIAKSRVREEGEGKKQGKTEYTVEVVLTDTREMFDHTSGRYMCELIIGDITIVPGVRWLFGSVQLDFVSSDALSAKKEKHASIYASDTSRDTNAKEDL